MSNVIQKVVRLKITTPVHPTNSWKEFRAILKQLHEETRLASNRCITHCNMEYCHNIDEKYACKDKKKLQNELYNIVRKYAPNLQSYNTSSISQSIYNLYFGNSKGSYVNKIKSGEGNPPMGYSKTIPIPIAGKKYFKFNKLENGQYNFSFSLVSQSFKKDWNETLHKKKVDACFKMTDGIFTVGVDVNAPYVRSIIDKCISGEYTMGGSQIVNKNNKYYIHLTYSFKSLANEKLNLKNIMGIDLGYNKPAYLAVNYNTYTRKVIGDRVMIDYKIKLNEKLRKQKMDAGIKNIRGHGRKKIVSYSNATRNKSHNFTETENRRMANTIVETAKNWNCGTIHMEYLKGIKSNNKCLENWTYYQLQQFIEQKAEKCGIKVEYVNPRNTSQRCSKCGFISKENRPKGKKGASYFCCVKCGHSIDADFNAALNIARSEPIKNKEKRIFDDSFSEMGA